MMQIQVPCLVQALGITDIRLLNALFQRVPGFPAQNIYGEGSWDLQVKHCRDHFNEEKGSSAN